MIRAVLDTNILISGILGVSTASSAPPAIIIHRWVEGRFELALSDHILSEVRRTLAKPWFSARIDSIDVEAILGPMIRSSIYATVSDCQLVAGIASHPEDDYVLATALATNARSLVTGDERLLALMSFHDVAIQDARQFLGILDATS